MNLDFLGIKIFGEQTFRFIVDSFKKYWAFEVYTQNKTFLTEYIFDPRMRRDARAVV